MHIIKTKCCQCICVDSSIAASSFFLSSSLSFSFFLSRLSSILSPCLLLCNFLQLCLLAATLFKYLHVTFSFSFFPFCLHKSPLFVYLIFSWLMTWWLHSYFWFFLCSFFNYFYLKLVSIQSTHKRSIVLSIQPYECTVHGITSIACCC